MFLWSRKPISLWRTMKNTMRSPPWKNVHFSTVWTSCFYTLKRRFFVLEYRKRHFGGLYCLKKKLKKSPFFGQQHRLTPLENVNFSTFWTSGFYSLERRFFDLECRKRQFTGLYYQKKNLQNNHFWTKTMKVNPFLF